MEIQKIEFFGPITHPVNACVDVLVTLEDFFGTNEVTYCIEVTTPQFLTTLMKKKPKSNFVEPDYPCIIVSRLTRDIIQEAIQAYVDEEEDLYWLKLYHLPAALNIEDINEILARKEKEYIELEAEVEEEMKAENQEFDDLKEFHQEVGHSPKHQKISGYDELILRSKIGLCTLLSLSSYYLFQSGFLNFFSDLGH